MLPNKAPDSPLSKRVVPRRAGAGAAVSIQHMAGATKLVYCLTLVGAVLPLGMSGWVGLTVGGTALSFLALLGKYAVIALSLLVVLAMARIWRILRDPDVLSAYVYSPFQSLLLKVSVVLLYISGLAFALRLFSPVIATLMMGSRGAGIGAYALSVWFTLLGMAGPLALFLFEYSRLLGFEYARRNKGSTDVFLVTQPPE